MFVEPSKLTVADYLATWLADVAPARVSPKSLERYQGLVNAQIIPFLGAQKLQKLRPSDVMAWHGELLKVISRRGRPLSPRTVRHAHQVLRKALADAATGELVPRNVAALVKPPTVHRREMQILSADQVVAALRRIEGTEVHAIAVVAFATGMRRGELCGLRWSDVDLDAGTVRVERSLEQTAAGLRFKAPKTESGRRTIGLPAVAVECLRKHRSGQLELRLALGLGRMANDMTVFALPDGNLRPPHTVSDQWRRAIAGKGLPKVGFHSLRHAHASALIAAGVDAVSVSRRLGHGSAAITLGVYGHLFANKDDRAETAIDGVFAAG